MRRKISVLISLLFFGVASAYLLNTPITELKSKYPYFIDKDQSEETETITGRIIKVMIWSLHCILLIPKLGHSNLKKCFQ